MKIILQQNVRKIGQKGDIVEVNDGYAHNFLFPQGLARSVSKAVVAQVKAVQQKQEDTQKQNNTLLIEFLKNLTKEKVVVQKPANDKGILFSAVHIDDIISVVQAQTQGKFQVPITIFKQDIKCKEVGALEVPYQIDAFKGVLKVDVRAE